MTILTGKEIEALTFPAFPNDDFPLIRNFVKFAEQVQPAGFDLTLQKVTTPKRGEMGKLLQREKQLISTVEVNLAQVLDTLTPYLFYTNEVFYMPANVSAFVYPRSTLMRMGCQFVSAMVDAGYKGQLSFSVLLMNPLKVERNARFAQIIFHRHAVTKPYDGQYQGQGLK
jgi:dUTP pyrophosphatase